MLVVYAGLSDLFCFCQQRRKAAHYICCFIRRAGIAGLPVQGNGGCHAVAVRGDLFAETSIRRTRSLLWLAADDPDAARDEIDDTSWIPAEGRYHLQHWYKLEGLTEIAIYERRAAEVRDAFAQEYKALRASLLLRVQMVRCIAGWLWARLALSAAQEHPDGDSQALWEASKIAKKLQRERMPFAWR